MSDRIEIQSKRRERRRRRAHFRIPYETPGASPGQIHVDSEATPSEVTLIAYRPDHVLEKRITDLEEIPRLIADYKVAWLNIDGLGTANVLVQVGEIFRLHRLALEDVVNAPQRPKVDEYGEQCFILLQMPQGVDEVDTEQVSIFLGEGFVVTFQENVGDCLDPVRERIRHGRGRIRHAGADYLAYALLDAIVDSYNPVLEQYSEYLEDIEEAIVRTPKASTLQEVHRIRRDVTILHSTLWPLRELISALLRDSKEHFAEETRYYLRDCYDHAIRMLEVVGSYRGICTDLMEFYMLNSTKQMNEVMKVLTVLATVFIPLTFIASVYGMNFDPKSSPWNMPELEWKYGYLTCLGVMLVLSLLMLVYFRRRRWF